MPFSLRRWRAPHLLGAWVAYWAALGIATLGPYVDRMRRVTKAPDNKGSISLTVESSEIALRIVENGRTVTDAGISILTLALLVAGPPLLLWLLWLVARPRRETRATAAIDAGPMRDVRVEEREHTPERGAR